ncbi:MAG TPA: LXG domain-containing protein [Chondromyces sp.]|nr:LXG domain-containing protein [Chondromyces sp.]
MKILDVDALHTGIDEILEKLASQELQMKQVENEVKGVVTLDDSFKGEGGKAIRSFYQECHEPFLLFYQQFITDYQNKLKTMKTDLQSLEPAQSGFIRQSYLDNELEQGLEQVKTITTELANEANQSMGKVQDIVSLPLLEDDNFLQELNRAKMEKQQTIERMYEFDHQQITSLSSVEEDVQTMTGYVSQIGSMFQSGDLTINGYQSGQIFSRLSEETLTDVGSSAQGTVAAGVSTRENAMRLLQVAQETKGEVVGNPETEEATGLLSAFKDGMTGALVPLAMMGLLQKTGLLRIEFTKKKNHYTFKYNKTALKFLKGKTGPKSFRKLITTLNQKSKTNAQIEKNLKAKKRGDVRVKNYKDSRSFVKKVEAKMIKSITKNRPVHENVKGKLFKGSARDMVIEKKVFKKVAGKTSFVGAIAVGSIDALMNSANRMKENSEKYQGEKLAEMNGRAVGEEVNKVAGSAVGAGTGAYIGAAIGGLVSGPFAPFGAAAGAVIGGAVGASVGEWASKYTSKWASDAGAAAGKAIHNMKEGAKKALDEAKDKLFGWI